MTKGCLRLARAGDEFRRRRFDTEDGKKTLGELFEGRSQLLAYNIMFGPDYEVGACPGCTSLGDGLVRSAARRHAVPCGDIDEVEVDSSMGDLASQVGQHEDVELGPLAWPDAR